MASKEGKSPRRKSRTLNYFYLEVADHGNLLHKKLHINRAQDTITAWCYPLHKRVAYTYSDTLKRKGKAFSTVEVGKLINRSRVSIENAIIRGDLAPPQKTYGLNERKNGFAYYWSEKDVIAAHAYFSTVHRGRPRRDGLVTPGLMPTIRELRAMMRDEEILYVKQGDTFLPTWKAEQF